MTTAADLISATEQHLLSGDRDELNKLAADVDDTTSTITFAYALGGIQQGSYVATDLEVMYVWDVDPDALSATVQRGMLGSVPAAHSAGALAFINPINSKASVFDALNAELSSLAGDGLFAIKSFDLVTQSVAVTYAVPADNVDLLQVLECRWSDVDATESWPKIDLRQIQILREQPTTTFPSGVALRIDESFVAGRTLRVKYAAPFVALTGLASDVVTDAGLPATAVDIPPLGAAARVIATREAKRSLTERATDPRRASEVPPGSAARASAVLFGLRDKRVRAEVTLLRQKWPQ